MDQSISKSDQFLSHEVGFQPGAGSSPVRPSTASLIRSACPVCLPYSSIMSHTSRRRLACSPSMLAWTGWSRPPSASASATRSRDRATAASQSSYSARGESPAAVLNSQSGLGVPVDLRPRRAERRPGQLLTELMVLDQGQVLEQPAQRQRGRADPAAQPGRVEPVRLVAERRPQPVERRQQLLGLGALQRRVPGGVCHSARLAKVPDILLPRKSSNPSSRTDRGDSAPPRPPMLAVIADQARRSDRTSQTCHSKKVSPAARAKSPPRRRTSVR